RLGSGRTKTSQRAATYATSGRSLRSRTRARTSPHFRQSLLFAACKLQRRTGTWCLTHSAALEPWGKSLSTWAAASCCPILPTTSSSRSGCRRWRVCCHGTDERLCPLKSTPTIKKWNKIKPICPIHGVPLRKRSFGHDGWYCPLNGKRDRGQLETPEKCSGSWASIKPPARPQAPAKRRQQALPEASRRTWKHKPLRSKPSRTTKSGRVILGQGDYNELCGQVWFRDKGRCRIQHDGCWLALPGFSTRWVGPIVKR